MPDSYSNIIYGGKCIYVVDELVGWLVRLLMDTPRLDHVSCGHRRAHRCQSIILSAASDLKWPFNHFVRPDCIDHSPTAQMNSGWCHRRISDYSVQSISNGEMKHHHSCPLILVFICWISFLLRQLVWRSSLHRLRAFNACAKREVSVFSLYKIPLHPGPPVGAVATELPTHSNSAAHDKPSPRARTCRTWVNKRIRAKPVNCGQ